jgi:hypothetical protein
MEPEVHETILAEVTRFKIEANYLFNFPVSHSTNPTICEDLRTNKAGAVSSTSRVRQEGHRLTISSDGEVVMYEKLQHADGGGRI